MQHFLNLVEQDHHDFTQDLALKLRILFMRKSGTDALFETMSNLLGITILVNVPESLEEEFERKDLSGIPKPSFAFNNEVQQWFNDGNRKIQLLDAISRPKATVIGEYEYSVKEIIETVIDKLGGAHIDPKLKV